MTSTSNRAAASASYRRRGRKDFSKFYESQAVGAALSQTSIHLCCVAAAPCEGASASSVVSFGLDFMLCMATVTGGTASIAMTQNDANRAAGAAFRVASQLVILDGQRTREMRSFPGYDVSSCLLRIRSAPRFTAFPSGWASVGAGADSCSAGGPSFTAVADPYFGGCGPLADEGWVVAPRRCCCIISLMYEC